MVYDDIYIYTLLEIKRNTVLIELSKTTKTDENWKVLFGVIYDSEWMHFASS